MDFGRVAVRVALVKAGRKNALVNHGREVNLCARALLLVATVRVDRAGVNTGLGLLTRRRVNVSLYVRAV